MRAQDSKVGQIRSQSCLNYSNWAILDFSGSFDPLTVENLAPL